MKKVLLLFIDALASRIVQPAIEAGRLPNLGKLVDAGSMNADCISIFPSITPAATCTLTTGCYPFEHGISGAYWYDADRGGVAYFGDDIWPILNAGVNRYVLDFQRNLNERRLQASTLFEHLERNGKLRGAVINNFWFRGSVEHEVSLPLVFRLAPIQPAASVRGPQLMFMGDFVNSPLPRGQILKARGGMLRRFGFHDETAADFLLQLAEEKSLPDVTLAYFPNNDFTGHAEGPHKAESVLAKIDENLGRLYEIHGGLQQMLQEVAVIVTGDHSQSDLESANGAAIDLAGALTSFKVAKAGDAWQSEDELMVCPNMRAAQVYFQEPTRRRRGELIDSLLGCDGVDQVIWCSSDDGLPGGLDVEFHVATADRGALQFAPAADESAMAADAYGAGWRWRGELATLDATVAEGQIQFGEYPNAFERIAASFFRQSGNLWVTARLGREFCLPETSCHDGGSHGSLHLLDSQSPLITAGFPASIAPPANPRIVDVVPLCLQLLDIAPSRLPGDSHVRRACAADAGCQPRS